jgi:DNA-directed RNA polymerase specialized sigma24 family protein
MHPGQRTVVKHLAKALSPRERLIVILRFADGLSCADIGRLVNIPPAEVWSILDDVRQLAANGLLLWRAC